MQSTTIESKDIRPEDVKEISMTSDHVFMGFDNRAYTDLLRISEHWSSYRRTNYHTKKIDAEWSYQSKSKRRESVWKSVAEEFLRFFQTEELLKTWVTDRGGFHLRLTLKDGTRYDRDYDADFEWNHLTELATYLKKLIPVEEKDYPDVLNKMPIFLTEEAMTHENMEHVSKEELCALMYAEGGAMGRAGEVCILTTGGTKFYLPGWYDMLPEGEGTWFEQQEVIETFFDGFQHVHGFLAEPFRRVEMNDRTWFYINLGFGNHLYLRDDFFEEHGSRLLDSRPSEAYQKWQWLVEDAKRR